MMHEAATHASARTVAFMMDLFKETVRTQDQYLIEMPLILLYYACQGNNLEVLEWVLKKAEIRFPGSTQVPFFSIDGSRKGWDDILALTLESESGRMFQELLPEFIVKFGPPQSSNSGCPAGWAMTQRVIQACAGRPDSEERLHGLWDSLHALYHDGKVKRQQTGRNSFVSYLSPRLCFITDTVCAIKLAKAMLSYGTEVDYTAKGSTIYATPLHRTLRKSNPQTAEMARFLLYRGADPERTCKVKFGVKSIKDEVGAREISKWIGMMWDELVQKVKEDREAGICPPEYI
ncbi:hypothetical protein V8F06_013645 [Rhypophila decipiens]